MRDRARLTSSGSSPPAIQSSSSTVCTTGTGPPESWVMQPMLPAAIRSGRCAARFVELARAQAGGDVRLQQVVGAGRAAAEMRAPAGSTHHEAGPLQQGLRLRGHTLAVLQAARGMIGDGQARRLTGRLRSRCG